ncbi:chromosome 22 open reading frame 15, isoform CRA_c [Homo sapiens]|uniref:Chromosome 22 open reading frame 15 n=1 Tax=Homo sapiens TaxID=9606 RepID=Q14D93_HUMAN|nr:Chromosome 22 open reading frame 15 [Homo sapiens]AAI13453.2 Chromosome 22 open reading frame 15 [Homo sapiens]EAW59601.1 chromosome 22 open reading frame 15, isoform CRA_c [Homo sapiens]
MLCSQPGLANSSRVRGRVGTIRPVRCPSSSLHMSQRERTWPPPAMSPYWRTWMTITQSWQVSVRVQPRGRAHLLPNPYQQDFLGLPEELRRLSGLSSVGHNWRKRMGTRRGRHEQSPTSRPRKVSSLPPRSC